VKQGLCYTAVQRGVARAPCPGNFLRVLGPRPYRVDTFSQSSARRRRYGEIHRLYKHSNFQSDPQPSPGRCAGYLPQESRSHWDQPQGADIRFEEDNWESPTSVHGHWWQVLLDGLESPSSPTSSKSGELISPISVELTMAWNVSAVSSRVESVYDLRWSAIRLTRHPADGRTTVSDYSFDRRRCVCDSVANWNCMRSRQGLLDGFKGLEGGARSLPLLAPHDMLKCSNSSTCWTQAANLHD